MAGLAWSFTECPQCGNSLADPHAAGCFVEHQRRFLRHPHAAAIFSTARIDVALTIADAIERGFLIRGGSILRTEHTIDLAWARGDRAMSAASVV